MGSHAPATLDRSVVRSRSSSRASRLRRSSRPARARLDLGQLLIRIGLGGSRIWRAFVYSVIVLFGLGMLCGADHYGSAPVEFGVDHVVVTNSPARAIAGLLRPSSS